MGTVVATLVGAAVLLSEFFMRSWLWGGFRGRRGNDAGGGAGALIVFAIGFVLMALAPLAGQIIKMSVSRNREYLADAQGAMLTRYPPGLISALRKIQTAPTAMRSANNATGSPLAEPALAGRRGEDHGDGAALLDPPAARGADQAARGDVTNRSRSGPGV